MNDLRQPTGSPVFTAVGDTAVSEPDDIASVHPVSADLVGRVVAGLASTVQLLRRETARSGKRMSTCDPDESTDLIVEWGISLAWADNPVLAYVDEALIDSTVRALAGGISCLEFGGAAADRAELHHMLGDTIAALRAPLWRCY